MAVKVLAINNNGKFKDVKVLFKACRLRFNDLRVPRSYKDTPDLPKNYSVVLFLTDEDLKEFDKAVEEAAKLFWGDKWQAKLRQFRKTEDHNPARKQVTDNGEVFYTINCKASEFIKRRNGVTEPRKLDVLKRNKQPVDWNDDSTVDENGNPAKHDIPYNGCYVNVVADLYASDNGSTSGIYPALTTVQFVRDGEPLGSAKTSDAQYLDDLSDDGEDGETEVDTSQF